MGKAYLSRTSGIRLIILFSFLSLFLLQKDTAHAGSFSAIHDGSGTVNFTGGDSFDCVVPGMEGYGSVAYLYADGQLFLAKTYPGVSVDLNEKLEMSCYAPRTYTFKASFGGGIRYPSGSCIFSGHGYLYSEVQLSNTPILTITAPDRISKKQASNLGANYTFRAQKDSCYDAVTNTDRCKARTAGLYIDGALLISDSGFGNLGVSGALTYTFDPAKTPISSGFHTVRATAGCVSTGSSAEKTVYVEPEDDPCLKVGKPVNVASGNVYIDKTDFILKGVMPVEFTRYYNSGAALWRGFGQYWSHTYDTRVITFGTKTYRVMNPNGVSAYAWAQEITVGLIVCEPV